MNPEEQWCLQKAEDESGNLVIITSNLGYRDFLAKKDASWLLEINITTQDQNANGHPTEPEASVLNELEDQITAAIAGSGTTHFIGRATTKGFRELVYYVNDAEKTNSVLTTLVNSKAPLRQWEYRMGSDPEWKRAEHLVGGTRQCL